MTNQSITGVKVTTITVQISGTTWQIDYEFEYPDSQGEETRVFNNNKDALECIELLQRNILPEYSEV